MTRFIVALAAVSFILLFGGCGQSGPLYLPGNPSKLETVAPASAEPKEEEEEEENEGG